MATQLDKFVEMYNQRKNSSAGLSAEDKFMRRYYQERGAKRLSDFYANSAALFGQHDRDERAEANAEKLEELEFEAEFVKNYLDYMKSAAPSEDLSPYTASLDDITSGLSRIKSGEYGPKYSVGGADYTYKQMKSLLADKENKSDKTAVQEALANIDLQYKYGSYSLEELTKMLKNAKDAHSEADWQADRWDPRGGTTQDRAGNKIILSDPAQGRTLINAKKDTRRELDELQKAVAYKTQENYESLPESPDFEELSKKGSELSNPSFQDAVAGSAVKNKVTFTKAISEGKEAVALDAFPHMGATLGKNFNPLWLHMTDAEVSTYNALLARDGEESADAYLNYLEGTLNAREGEVINQNYPKWGVAVSSGLERWGRGIYEGLTGDVHSPSPLQQAHQQNIAESELGGRILYGGISSVANMLPSILIGQGAGALGASASAAGTIGAVAMGAGAAGNAYADAVREGKTEDEATAYGLLTGASEAALQKLLGGVKFFKGAVPEKIGQVAQRAMKKAASNPKVWKALSIAGNMGSEGLEEYLQEVLDPVFRNVIFDENNQIKLFSQEALEAGITGALTAGIMNAPGDITEIVANRAQTRTDITDLGKRNQSPEVLSGLIESAKSMGEKSEVYKIAGEIEFAKANGREVSDYTVGQFVLALNTAQERAVRVTEKQNTKAVRADPSKPAAASASPAPASAQAIQEAARQPVDAPVSGAEAGRSIDIPVIKKLPYAPDLNTQASVNGTPVTIRKVTAENGEVSAQLSTGAVAPVQSIDFADPDIGRIYSAAAEYEAPGAQAFIKNYDGKVPLDSYSKAFTLLYRDGQMGADIKASMSRGGYVDMLSAVAQGSIYHAGRRAADQTAQSRQTQVDARKVERAAQPAGTEFIRRAYTEEITPEQEAQISVIETIAASVGVKVALKDEIAEGAANGLYNRKTGEIEIAVRDTDNAIIKVFGHELTHYIKEMSPAKYKAYSDFIVSELTRADRTAFDARVQRMIDLHRDAGIELSHEDAVEEVVADASEIMLRDSKAIARLAKKDRSLAERIRDFLKEWADKLQKAFDGITVKSLGAKYLEQNMDAAKKAQRLFDDALVDAVDPVVKTGEQSATIKYQINPHFNRAYDEWDGKPSGGFFKLGTVSEPLQSIGINPSKIYWDKNKIAKIKKEHPEMTNEVIKQVPYLLENPMLVMQSQTMINRVVVLGEVFDNSGTPVLAALELTPKGNIRDFVKVASAYKRPNAQYLIDTSDILYVNPEKNRTDEWLDALRLQLPAGLTLYGSIGRVTYVNRNVKGEIEFSSEKPGKSAIQLALEKAQQSSSTSNSIRENSKNDTDIRYQLRDIPDTDFNRALLDELSRKDSLISDLKEQIKLTQGHVLNKQAMRKFAQGILKKYSSKYSLDNLTHNLNTIFSTIANAEENISYNETISVLKDVSTAVLKESVTVDKSLYDQYTDLREYMREASILLNENQVQDIIRRYDSFGKFRNQNFGRVSFSRYDGTGASLDSIWGELSERWPELFPEDTHELDQATVIADALAAIQPRYESGTYNGMTADEIGADVALELFDGYFSIPEVRTFADKQQDKLLRTQAHYRRMITELRREKNQSFEKKIVRMRESARVQRETQAERRNKRAYRDQIERHALRLISWMRKPTDKNHVPDQMLRSVSDFITSIDFVSPVTAKTGQMTKKTANFRESLLELQSAFGAAERGLSAETDSDFYVELDPDFMATLQILVDSTKGVDRLMDLNAGQMMNLAYVTQQVSRMVTKANEFFSNGRFKKVDEAATASMQQMNEKREKKNHTGILRSLDKLLNIDQLDSFSFFEELGDVAETINDGLRAGFDAKTHRLAEARKYMEELLDGADVKAWSGKGAETHYFDTIYGELTMTTGQIMELYALSLRDQAQGHLFGGGVKPAPIAQRGKAGITKVLKATEPVKLDPQVLADITSVLTEEQIRIADGMRAFLTKNAAEWGNSASMLMFGYKKFTEPNYYPIKSDENYLLSIDPDKAASLSAIRNYGMTKSIMEGANNPLVLLDIFDTFTRHVDEMSTYSSLAAPVSDAMKWFNFNVKNQGYYSGSVKRSMERAFGPEAKNYFITFIKDLNGISAKPYVSDLSAALISNVKVAAVGANMRTVVQQPTAYARALMYIPAKYLTHARYHTSTVERMNENAPIALWKDWGFYEIDTGRAMREIIVGDQTLSDKIREGSLWLAGKADTVTWATLYNAVELEVADTTPELAQGSKEFNEEVGKRFSKMIDRTQVVDTPFHRSQIMRSKDFLMKTVTSFMGEPTKSYNLLRSAFVNMVNQNTTETRRAFGRATMAFTLSSVLAAAAAALMDAMRDDDEELSFGEKYFSAALWNSLENLNPLSLLPLAKDAMSIVQGFSVKRMDMTAAASIWNSVKGWIKYFGGESKKSLYELIQSSATAASQISGIPAGNLLRDLWSVYNTAVTVTRENPEDMTVSEKFVWAQKKYDLKKRDKDGSVNAAVSAVYYDILLEAEEVKDQATYDAIYKALLESGRKASAVKNALESRKIKILRADKRVKKAAAFQKGKDNYNRRRILDALVVQGYNKDLVEAAITAELKELHRAEAPDPQGFVAAYHRGVRDEWFPMYEKLKLAGWSHDDLMAMVQGR